MASNKHTLQSYLVIPQALSTGFASRLRNGQTSLLMSTSTVRTNKRSSNIVSYAEIDEDFDEDDEFSSDGRITLDGYKKMTQTQTDVQETIKSVLASKTNHFYASPESLKKAAEEETIMIPIRIHLEVDTNRVVDFFFWNLSEELITPEQFASIMCSDLDISPAYISQIASSIKTQIAEYKHLATISLPEETDLHVIIHLSVNLDKQLYEDKFEWNLSGKLTPQEFSQIVVDDLGLSAEFCPAIAHALLEATLTLKKEAVAGHLGQEVENLSVLHTQTGLRMDAESIGDDWVPTVEILSQWEMDKREIERERNIRRLKRESMRMGDVSEGLGKRRSRRRYDEGSPVSSPGYGW